METFTGRYILVSTDSNNPGYLTYDRLPRLLKEPYIGRRSSEGFGYEITKIKEKAAEFTQENIFKNEAIAEKVNSGTLEMWAVYEDPSREGYILKNSDNQYVMDVVFSSGDIEVDIAWTPEILFAKIFSKDKILECREKSWVLRDTTVYSVSSTRKVVLGPEIKDFQ